MKSKTKTLIILSGIFLSMLILNLITPLIMDDFSYAFGTTGRVQNLKDIFDFQIWYYLHWGGRNVAHTLAQFFLMNNKLLFNIMNSAIYTLLIYLTASFAPSVSAIKVIRKSSFQPIMVLSVPLKEM